MIYYGYDTTIDQVIDKHYSNQVYYYMNGYEVIYCNIIVYASNYYMMVMVYDNFVDYLY